MGRPLAGLDKYLKWQELLESQASSGIGVEKFCIQRGISPHTFRNWRERLRDGFPERMVALKEARDRGELGEGGDTVSELVRLGADRERLRQEWARQGYMSETEVRVELGWRLKHRREELGLTQTDVGARAGMTQTGYSLIEQGNRQPTLFTLLKISRALRLSVSEFLAGME